VPLGQCLHHVIGTLRVVFRLPAIFADCATWREISTIEEASSSDATATVCTLLLASSAAVATLVACWMLCPPVCDMDWAVDCNSVPAADTWPTNSTAFASNACVRASTFLPRSARSASSAS
jgi:hypothetical protein